MDSTKTRYGVQQGEQSAQTVGSDNGGHKPEAPIDKISPQCNATMGASRKDTPSVEESESGVDVFYEDQNNRLIHLI